LPILDPTPEKPITMLIRSSITEENDNQSLVRLFVAIAFLISSYIFNKEKPNTLAINKINATIRPTNFKSSTIPHINLTKAYLADKQEFQSIVAYAPCKFNIFLS
jgi:hypothetical protein